MKKEGVFDQKTQIRPKCSVYSGQIGRKCRLFAAILKYYTGMKAAHNLLTTDSNPTAFQLVSKNGLILPLPFLFASLLLGERILE